MYHIILWKLSVEYRTQEIREKIFDKRREIESIIESNNCLSHNSLFEIWNKAFLDARDLASIENSQAELLDNLANDEVITKNM
jgi:hypothetical protein